MRASGGLKAGKYKTAPVIIGENVWIGANSIVLRGTRIGDRSVIAAGCVVHGEIPPDTILIQRREDILRPIHSKE